MPNGIVVCLTQQCFMRCSYCYAGAIYCATPNSSYDMNLEILREIIRQSKNLDIKQMELTGGDPFARDDIFEVLDLFEINNISINLSTKKRLNSNEIDRLKQYKCINSIQISLDTISNSKAKKLVGEDDYVDTRMEVLSSLIDAGVNVKTNTVITKLNVSEIVELIDCSIKLGVNEVVLSPYMSNLNNRHEFLFPSVTDYIKLSRELKRFQNKKIVNYPDFLDSFEESSLHNQSRNGCGAGLDGLIISPNGDVCVCERMAYDSSYILGNIMIDSLVEIWNGHKINEYYKPKMEKFKGTDCYACEEFDYCVNRRGICFVHSKILNGSIYSPDNQCSKKIITKRIY